MTDENNSTPALEPGVTFWRMNPRLNVPERIKAGEVRDGGTQGYSRRHNGEAEWHHRTQTVERLRRWHDERIEVPVADKIEGLAAMGTAPHDGTEVLIMVEKRAGVRGKFLVGHWMPGGHCIEDAPPIDRGWYFWNGCMFDLASKPVGWLPLPEVAP